MAYSDSLTREIIDLEASRRAEPSVAGAVFGAIPEVAKPLAQPLMEQAWKQKITTAKDSFVNDMQELGYGLDDVTIKALSMGIKDEATLVNAYELARKIKEQKESSKRFKGLVASASKGTPFEGRLSGVETPEDLSVVKSLMVEPKKFNIDSAVDRLVSSVDLGEMPSAKTKIEAEKLRAEYVKNKMPVLIQKAKEMGLESDEWTSEMIARKALEKFVKPVSEGDKGLSPASENIREDKLVSYARDLDKKFGASRETLKRVDDINSFINKMPEDEKGLTVSSINNFFSKFSTALNNGEIPSENDPEKYAQYLENSLNGRGSLAAKSELERKLLGLMLSRVKMLGGNPSENDRKIIMNWVGAGNMTSIEQVRSAVNSLANDVSKSLKEDMYSEYSSVEDSDDYRNKFMNKLRLQAKRYPTYNAVLEYIIGIPEAQNQSTPINSGDVVSADAFYQLLQKKDKK